jgi:hypothetical protein
MSFLKRRNRMVIFRVTEDEYENLKTVCSVRGARNLSDFARSELLQSAGRELQPEAAVAGHLSEIEQRLASLQGMLQQMASRLEGK